MTGENVKKTYKATTFYYVMLGLFTALSCVATLLVQIPFGPMGYINFGDAVVMIAGVVLGPVGGAVTGGIGPALADIFTGYVVYAPFTAVIKAVEGLLCGLIYKKAFRRSGASWLKCLISFVSAALWVTLGYALTDFFLVVFGASGFESYGFNAALAAGALTVTGSLVQTGVSAAVALIVSPKLPRLAYGKLFAEQKDAGGEKEA